MVQGSSSYDHCLPSRMTEQTWDKTSKRSGYEAIQKREQERKEKEQEEKKYGSWGSTFKNKEHFTNLHHC